MKKYRFTALMILIIVQLCVPAYMVGSKYYTLKRGTEVKFEVRPFDPYDPFRGRYVSIRPELFMNDGINRYKEYGIISIDENGYAKIEKTQKEKPKDELYIRSKAKNFYNLPIDRYYMNEKLAPKAEKLTWSLPSDNKVYVTARILNGSLVVSGLYVNDVPIEDYVRSAE